MILRSLVSGAVLLGALILPLATWDAAFENEVVRNVRELSERNNARRQRAMWQLERAEAAAIPVLIESFGAPVQGPNRLVQGGHRATAEDVDQANTLAVLHNMTEGLVIDSLIEALGEDDDEVRHSAGLALASFGSRAMPAIIEVLESSPDARARVLAAWCLSFVGPGMNRAERALQRAAKDPVKDVRNTANFALGQLATRDASYWDFLAEWRRGARKASPRPDHIEPRRSEDG